MKVKYFCVLLLILVFAGTSCQQKSDKVELHMANLSEIQKEAKTFSYKGTNFSLKNNQVIIPDSNQMENVTFEVLSDTDSIESKFVDNLKRMLGKQKIDKSKIYYSLVNLKKDSGYDEIPMEKATKEQKTNPNGYLMYFDGTNQEVLTKTSLMCELGSNEIPKKYLKNKNFDSPWIHIGVETGVTEKHYLIPEEDISKVSYPLADGEYALQAAVNDVEKQIKDYNFVGSDLLDYKVYEADVNKLQDGVYYYQFKVKAVYKGASLVKDQAQYENEDLVQLNHIAAVFEKGKLGYVWSSAHSYETIADQEVISKMISPEDACKIVEKNLSSKKEFDIKSMELLYMTEFEYDDDRLAVERVKIFPVYHFCDAKPSLSGYAGLYFDVNAVTGEFMTGINQAQQ